MQIAVVSTPFLQVPPRNYGGTELVVYELVEGLIDQGHDVTLFATGDSCTRARLCCLYLEAQWPPAPLTDINHVSWAFKQLAEESYDIVHVHSAVALAMGRISAGPPLVYTIHHDRVQEFSGYYRQFPEVQFVAISHRQKQLEIVLPRCEVIHHGLDPERFECVDKPGDYVCFIGRFAEVKGPHIAIDVARRAGVPIVIGGEVHPPDRPFAERELKSRLGLPHVTYMGGVNVSLKVPLLRDARALLAPLQWEEPFGLIMIEAMLSGCPVVAFPRGSAPELIEQGVTGFLVDTPEAMADAISPGSAVYSFDRRRCRRQAMDRFSRKRMVSDHLRLYERLLANSSLARNGGRRPTVYMR